ncbi:unnamed protein product [Eruca vesicaria subsp. sativa]|uniref:Uncharacterized protein n=1 Tax=Eruca vesicaria subsp. sativa TaxID=29727 RepID=A0ABC8LNV1_ERUVS|nr:unnamed protein product [Eruca vesicaria subsp. sativa]
MVLLFGRPLSAMWQMQIGCGAPYDGVDVVFSRQNQSPLDPPLAAIATILSSARFTSLTFITGTLTFSKRFYLETWKLIYVIVPLGHHEIKCLVSVSFIARHGGDRFLLDTVQKMYASFQENSSIIADPKSSKRTISQEESAEIAKEKIPSTNWTF